VYNVYEYDVENRLISETIQRWINGGLVNDYRNIFYYETIINTSQPELVYPVQIFPNPSKGELTIDLGENEISNGQMNVYNPVGQLIHTQQLQGEQITSFQLNGIIGGIYCLQILIKERQTTRTFIIAP